VGVVYGSPTSLVATLIRKAVEEHGRVLARPEPILVFHDFGDNSLVFEVYFWVEVATMMDVKVICSDVRFRIDKLFREGGIVIAFPQRDVHLDTAGLLEVRLRGPEEDDSADDAPSKP
jgi:small-conductance mechanosensitive channel